MKLLMIFTNRFAYKPGIKTLETVENVKPDKVSFEHAQTAFIQVEETDDDSDTLKSIETKLVKNLKWIARKNKTNLIILHSFAHLSESKASPEVSKRLFDNVETRLTSSGYEVYQTPFGYFLDLDIEAPGFSLARVFKSF
ncbi:MAG: threonyl-tRNA synthetase editing domain-containing protein [Bacteroidetes bacterium]|nr:threonyl-tRNA synthetase editing domain-containing protein [Bacteroidota bacterium]